MENKDFVPFHPLDAPLYPVNLIEASAGTGKTWNIAALFVRLVLLERLPVAQILVVTFTKAATAELKTRLRARLEQVAALLRSVPDAAADPPRLRQYCDAADGGVFLYPLLERALQQEPQERLLLRLKAAAGGFDNAAVYTIHGFCQRVLQDFAFFCGAPFDIELDETAAHARLLTPAQDFWRSRVARSSTLAELAYRHRLTPQSRLEALKPFLSKPYLHLPEATGDEQAYAAAQREFAQSWQDFAANGLQAAEQAFWLLHPLLNKVSFKESVFAEKFAALHRFAARNHPPAPSALLAVLQNSSGTVPFAEEFLISKVNKGKSADPFQAACVNTLYTLAQAAQQLCAAEKQALAALDLELLHYLREAVAEHKNRYPQRVFDDLLTDVAAALQPDAPHAEALAQALSTNWRVALIDEFQDTDPQQYAVFRRAFAEHGTPLFLVGDPKQAIYSFRGADIFAYLQAAADTLAHGGRYTLDTNFRSHRRLIDGIGTFFQRPQPFVLPEIHYPPVRAERADSRLNCPALPHALTLRWLNGNEEKENAAVLEQRAAAWCADEIALLLQQARQGTAVFKGRNLAAGDIAVLVRRRQDGARVQRELKKRRIQSVLLSRNNIFTEPEAEALAALLGFILQPQQAGLLRFVLAGCLFNQTADELLALNADETRLLMWTDAAVHTAEIWQQSGIYTALHAFIGTHGVETRLLAQGNERSLTNLHQLSELLAEEEENGHSPASLQQWLERKIQAARAADAAQADEHTLRLESDDDLIRIVTVHAAKGLQYPVVFCPFVWRSGGGHAQDWSVVHHDGQAALLHRDTLSADRNLQERLAQETLSEDLRLLYVALTRAEERLCLYLGSYRDSGKNALAYLLNAQDDAKNPEAYRARWQEFVRQNGGRNDMVWLEGAPPPYRADRSTSSTETAFQAACFAPRRFRFIRHTSFTGLMRQHSRAAEAAEAVRAELPYGLDGGEHNTAAPDPTDTDTDAVSDIGRFPQGTAAGLCLHDLLEHYPFARAAADMDGHIRTVLNRHGFDADIWHDAAAAMLDTLRHTALLPDTALAGLPPQNMVREMDFLFHAEHFRLNDIRAWLADPQRRLPESIVRAAAALQFYDIHGYLNGSIDLLCRTADGRVIIADYKSNRLGAHPADYTQDTLNAAMAEHHYYLQAFIYAVAAARYLKQRGALPPVLSVRYLFLRGLDGTDGHGIWSWDIPSADLNVWL